MKKQLIALTILISACTLQAQTQSTLTDKDKKFVIEASQGNLLEVRLGELAQKNGSSNQVKMLGQQMVADHTKAGNELKSIAERKNITVPYGLTPKQQMAYDKLAKKQGDEFDKAYTKCMVKDHKKDICEFKREAKHGSDVDVTTWASNTIVVLQHHKQMSIEACKAVHK